jgi:demethylmenaquinone methyltransferase/2-methoxy-6-polyprenyl-1,4-benzoquinol methylase
MDSSEVPKPATRNAQAVRAMFDRIAGRYDFANHLLSGGCDFWWRYRAVRLVRQWRPGCVLDLATGSGDLALAIVNKIPQAQVTAIDLSSEMLAVAKRKGLTNVRVADAQELPFGDQSFDIVTVAFGLRNMTDWSRALRESARILRASGHLLILDFSMPRGFLRHIYRFYLHRCLPRLAGIVTGEQTAYEYLGGSIENFPSGRAMIDLLESNGFRAATATPLTGGIVTLYSATKA